MVEEGMEAHTPKVKQAYIAGAGVSGGLLAGAAIVFISLVGLVSSTVWPESDHRLSPMNAVLDPVRGPESREIPAAAPPAPAPAPPPAASVSPPATPASAASPKTNAGKSADQRGGARKSGSTGDTKVTTAPPATVASTPDSSNPSRSGETGSSGGTARSGHDSGSGGSVKRATGKSSVTKQGKGKRSAGARGRGSNGHGQARGLDKHRP